MYPAGDWILHPTATRGQHYRQQQRLRDQVLQPPLKVRGQVGRRPSGQEARWAGQRQMLQMAREELGLDSGL